MPGCLTQFLLRERPQRLGTEQPCLDALASCCGDRRLGNTCGSAVCGDNDLRILTAVQLCIGLLFLDDSIALEPLPHLCLQQRGIQIQGVDDVVFPLVAVAVGSPVGLVRQCGAWLRKCHRLHHLSQQTVCQNHCRNPVLVRLVKCQHDGIHHLLYGTWCVYQNVKITVTHGVGCLVVIRLRRLDRTQTGTATLYVDNQRRQIGTCHVGNALCLQRNAGRGGGCHGTDTGRGCAKYHVDCCDLRFCLQKDTAGFLHALCHIRRQLGLRCDRVTKEALTACTDGSLCQCLIALHQTSFH